MQNLGDKFCDKIKMFSLLKKFGFQNRRTISSSGGHCFRLLKTLEGHRDWCTFVSYNKEGNLIVSSSTDRSLKVWNVESGECIKTLKGHTNKVNSAVFSSDGRFILSASSDKTIRVWNTESGEEEYTIDTSISDVCTMAVFSPDSKLIAAGCHDHKIKIYNAETKALIGEL